MEKTWDNLKYHFKRICTSDICKDEQVSVRTALELGAKDLGIKTASGRKFDFSSARKPDEMYITCGNDPNSGMPYVIYTAKWFVASPIMYFLGSDKKPVLYFPGNELLISKGDINYLQRHDGATSKLWSLTRA